MERALLVTIELDADRRGAWTLEDEQAELGELTRSSGCEIVGEVTARRHVPVAGTFLGSGKLEEIAQAAMERQAQVAVFSQELSPAQQRNIEDVLRTKTIDRTQLILDIFAQRARSQEGKTQVELAQLRYLMPRLIGKGVMLSRLGGGIGTRGPGEQKLEVDRRRVRARITRLSRELEKLEERRAATRRARREARVPVVALVGYTNAGKTTLLNRLTGAGSRAENRLFTTLDPLARRLRLPSGRGAVLIDTVGFLHHLPHQLIEAFRATLEETADADVLLHVLDASHPLAMEHAEAVSEVLAELDMKVQPRVTALNKMDCLAGQEAGARLAVSLPRAVGISALRGDGLPELLTAIESCLADSASRLAT